MLHTIQITLMNLKCILRTYLSRSRIRLADMNTVVKQALVRQRVAEGSLVKLEKDFYIKAAKAVKESPNEQTETDIRTLARMRRQIYLNLADTTEPDQSVLDKLAMQEEVYYRIICDARCTLDSEIHNV